MGVAVADGLGLGLAVAEGVRLGLAVAEGVRLGLAVAEGVGETGGADGDGSLGEHPTTSSTAPARAVTHLTRRPYVGAEEGRRA
ncbi:MAG TPA: hypothetical protein VK401_06330 [Propionibacteriaceae bacterium]|nr:hypothetical protein [Propionibacteriaceae bacterium]